MKASSKCWRCWRQWSLSVVDMMLSIRPTELKHAFHRVSQCNSEPLNPRQQPTHLFEFCLHRLITCFGKQGLLGMRHCKSNGGLVVSKFRIDSVSSMYLVEVFPPLHHVPFNSQLFSHVCSCQPDSFQIKKYVLCLCRQVFQLNPATSTLLTQDRACRNYKNSSLLQAEIT